jgi:surface protein
MSGMFQHATSFNQDISMWNVKNVKDMRSMFCKAKSFNQDLTKWNFRSDDFILEMYMCVDFLKKRNIPK